MAGSAPIGSVGACRFFLNASSARASRPAITVEKGFHGSGHISSRAVK
jgi:hypothetical protein